MRRSRKTLAVIAIILVVLAGIRLALPEIVRDRVNDRLSEMDDYRGHVQDVDLALLRGAYALNGIEIVKRNADIEQPFLLMDTLDLSLEWKALFKGRLVGEAAMRRPMLNLVQGENETDTQLGTGVNWPEKVEQLFPFEFDRVEVTDGTVTFRAPGIEADQSLTLSELTVLLRNLTNVRESDEAAFATFESAGRIMDSAPMKTQGRIDPNEQTATLDFNLALENAELVAVNPWLREFLGVDAEKGRFSLYAEMATADNRFEGYIKPILEDPTIFRLDEETKTPFHKLWEGLVHLVAKIFENPEEDQVATRIPLEGTLEDPDADLLATFVGLARNAFVAALSHSIENSITLDDVRGGGDGNDREDDSAPSDSP